MKILVTGSEGFIGSHLVESMVRKGYKVRCFILYNSFNSNGWLEKLPKNIKKKIEYFYGDIRDRNSVIKAVKGCHKVVNLASLIAIPYSYEAPFSYIETNIVGTTNLLQVSLDELERHCFPSFLYQPLLRLYLLSLLLRPRLYLWIGNLNHRETPLLGP